MIKIHLNTTFFVATLTGNIGCTDDDNAVTTPFPTVAEFSDLEIREQSQIITEALCKREARCGALVSACTPSGCRSELHEGRLEEECINDNRKLLAETPCPITAETSSSWDVCFDVLINGECESNGTPVDFENECKSLINLLNCDKGNLTPTPGSSDTTHSTDAGMTTK